MCTHLILESIRGKGLGNKTPNILPLRSLTELLINSPNEKHTRGKITNQEVKKYLQD